MESHSTPSSLSEKIKAKRPQIQELISLGKTEEALELLRQLTPDATLLESRYSGAKRQYSMGMIDFSEWSRTQAQINYAALEMLGNLSGGKETPQETKEAEIVKFSNKYDELKTQVEVGLNTSGSPEEVLASLNKIKEHVDKVLNEVDPKKDIEYAEAMQKLTKLYELFVKKWFE